MKMAFFFFLDSLYFYTERHKYICNVPAMTKFVLLKFLLVSTDRCFRQIWDNVVCCVNGSLN